MVMDHRKLLMGDVLCLLGTPLFTKRRASTSYPQRRGAGRIEGTAPSTCSGGLGGGTLAGGRIHHDREFDDGRGR
jgi:hypothetical protein